MTVTELQPLDAPDREAIIRKFLHRYRKSMTDDQRAALLAKADAGIPLYLLVALEELRTLGTYEEITDRIAQLPPDTRALFIWILKRLEDDDGFRDAAGQKIGWELVSRFVSLLGASRHGLSQQELVELLSPGDPQGNVAALTQLLRPYLMQRGGLLDFYHGQFREATEQEYLQTEVQRYDAHADLAAYFNHAERTRQPWRSAHHRSLTEFPYHLWQSGAREPLFDLARNERFLSAQREHLSEEPDLPFRTMRMALNAACVAENAVTMAEVTLAHAFRLVRQQAENPLDALLNQGLAPDVALRRAWGLADALDPQSRAYALLLLAWKLKALARLNEAGSSLKKLDERPLSDKGDYRALLVLLLAGLEPEFETSHWAAALMDDEGLKDLATRLAGQHQFESAKPIAFLDKARRFRDEALRAIAVAQAQSGCYAEALATVARIEPLPQTQAFYHHHKALLEIAKAQTQEGCLAEATSTADRVYREWRAEALVEIAAAQVKLGRFAEAIATAAKLETAELRASVLVDIGKEQARMGQNSDPVFDEATSTANGINRDQERFKALLKVAVERAHAGRVDGAISTTERMPTMWQRAEALGEIAVVQAQAGQDPRSTLRAALVYGGPRYLLDNFPKVMCKIAKVQAVMGRLTDATSTAEVIQDAAGRAEALVAIAAAQVRAGQDPRATFSSAVSTAAEVDWEIRRADALAAIAAAQAKAGLDPSSTFSCAVCAAAKVTDHERRVPVIIGIAVAQANAGQNPNATFAQAVSTVAEIAQAEPREEALAAIAAAQAKAGQLTEMASTSARIRDRRGINRRLLEVSVEQAQAGKFSEASSTAAEIDFPGYRIDAVCEIAAAQAQAGRFAEATSTAEQIDHAERCAKALIAIAATQAKAGQDPNPTLSQAASVAAGINQRKSRSETLAAIADAQLEEGLDPSSTLARDPSPPKNTCPKPRADALCAVAVVQTGLGRDPGATFAGAVSATSEVEEAWNRDKALNEIVEALTQAGQYDEATSTLARMKSGWSRSHALSKVAVAQAAVGRFADATSTAMRSEGTERIKALGAIGVAQARTGQDPRPTFAQAISVLAGEHYHPEGRASIIRRLAVEQAEAGLFAEATSTAMGIEYADNRADALCVIGTLEAKAGQDSHPSFARAQREAATIDDPLERACTMCFLAASMAQTDLSADWAFAEAISAARIEEDITRANLLFDVARAQAKAGRFAEATSTATTIEKAYQRAAALCDISDAQAKAGRFTDAASTAASIKDADFHASALMRIAEAQATAGLDPGPTIVLALDQAGAGYRRVDAKVLQEMVVVQLQMGRFAEAVAVATRIESKTHRVDSLCEIAMAQAKTGHDPSPTFAEAISTAVRSEKAEDQAKTLSKIAAMQSQLGSLTGALVTSDMILTEQAHGLNEVGSAMTKLTDRSKARAALNAYLPRAARHVESAWHSCGVIAQLFPDQSTELANFLIAFSRESA